MIARHFSVGCTGRTFVQIAAFLSKNDGLPRHSAINFDYIQTVSKGKIGSLITTLSAEKLKQVRKAMLFAPNVWKATWKNITWVQFTNQSNSLSNSIRIMAATYSFMLVILFLTNVGEYRQKKDKYAFPETNSFPFMNMQPVAFPQTHFEQIRSCSDFEVTSFDFWVMCSIFR